MKNNIIIGAVLIVISLTNLKAQDNIQASASVLSSFQNSFQGASNVRWSSLPKKITKATFSHLGDSYLAFFSEEGKLIATSRKVRSVDDLPLVIQTGFNQKKASLENKAGTFTIAHVYEMLKDGITKYYITMHNPQSIVFLSVDSYGMAVVTKKTKRTPEIQSLPKKNVIAKKN